MNNKFPVRHNTSFRSRVIGSALCFVLVLSAAAGCAGPNLFNPATLTPTSSVTPSATATLTPTPTQTFTPTVSPTATEVQTACGEPAVMSILLIGSDTRSNGYDAGLADAIRLVRVDFATPSVQLLTFQRDLYVEIPGIESHGGITHGKLNQSYFYGNLGYGEDPRLGPGLLASTLEYNFGAHADHYIAINLQTFSRFVDALGGIDIRLPYTVDGRVKGSYDRNRYFPAGDQHLNGYRTMLLARMRPQGDLQRSEIQNLVMQAVVKEMLDPATFLQLSKLNVAFDNSVQTDLGPVDMGRLICLSSMLDTQDIQYFHFPDALFKSVRVKDPVLGNTSVWDVDFDVLRTYVKLFEEGMWLEEVK